MSKTLLQVVMGGLICSLILVGCGRKGALEPKPVSTNTDTSTQNPADSPQQPLTDKPFILDRLIK